MSQLPQRHIHLDFHTSPFIEGVGADFDAETFAEIMVDARVDNVNIFAKCHHGMSYFPTKLGTVHPQLKQKDLLGEMIEALHRRDIRCPVYTTIVWEEKVADEHPEWRQMYADGRFAQLRTSADGVTKQPGGWRFNSFVNPDYQDYFEAHLSELIDGYDLDGLWMDILFHDLGADFSPAARKLRADWGVEEDNDEDNAIFESLAQQAFAERFTAFIHGKRPGLPLFYNSSNRAFLDSRYGWARRADHMPHMEIESLPSGFWGYFHYPRLARQAMTWDKPFVGMTGRFQKMWGDFGGCKPQAALEYECFRTQASGGACSVGDQMHPRGTLDREAYRMIGRVYEQVEAAEAFYADSHAEFQGAVYLAGSPGQDETLAGQSEEGAVLMMEELKLDVAVLDDRSDPSPYRFVILPDSTRVTPELATRLKRYHEAGGIIIGSFAAGCDAAGQWQLDFLPLTPKGKAEIFPSYWRPEGDFAASLGQDGRVIYQQGMILEAGETAQVPLHRMPSYFNRSDLRFCSHFQTPPDPSVAPDPALVVGKGFAFFADPIFSEYRQAGNVFLRDVLAEQLSNMGIDLSLAKGLDPHVQVYQRRQGEALNLTLLNYMPSRKSMAIDVIERGLSFAGQTLQMEASSVQVWPDGPALSKGEHGWELPGTASGRLLLQVT